jgi:hypothetical protein
VFYIAADLATPAGSIGDFDVTFEAYEDPFTPFTASVDAITHVNKPSADLYDSATGGTVVSSFAFPNVDLPDTVYWTAAMYLQNRHATDDFNVGFDILETPEAGITIHAQYWDGSQWVDWSEADYFTASVVNGDSLQVRWGISAISEAYSPTHSFSLQLTWNTIY